MDSQVRVWRDEGKHLPPFMRDFHDAKELFKSIDQYIVCEDGHPANQVNWIQAQCYTIDVFLWFMAQHGYTLQKNRTKLPFDDLPSLLKELKEERKQIFSNALMSALTTGKDDESKPAE